MTSDKNRTSDGYGPLTGGMDSGISPSEIRSNQVAFAVNATMRGSFIAPRPGFNRRTLQFPSASGANDPALQSSFEAGKFQGAKPYRKADGDDTIMIAISGRMFKVDIGKGFQVQDITIPGNPNSSLLEFTWMEQAEEFFVMQDGNSAPYIFNGAFARRGTPSEIPTGTVMAYVMGRLWIASPNRRQFIASDLVYGPSGTATYNYRDSVLKMTENALLSTGGAFSLPDNAGPITAMRAIANLDTSNGQGPLMVFTLTNAFSINAPVDRTLWKAVNFPIQSVAMIGPGPVSSNGVVNVNSDLWFRSSDGIRSLILARRNFQQSGQSTFPNVPLSWANTPFSDEMRPILDLDQKETLDHASCVFFDNRLLETISPVWTERGTSFRGAVAMDFSVVSGIGRQTPPAWEGVWTGVRILQVLIATISKVERCFMIVLSPDNKIELWELSRADRNDNGTKRIVWSHDSRSMGFRDLGSGLKQLMYGQQWIDNVAGQVNFQVQFRPDQYPLWIDWTAWSECATMDNCSTPPSCSGPPQSLRLQYRPDIRFPQPPNTCDVAGQKPVNLGFEFQVRETVTGYCRIKKVLLHAHDRDESPRGSCPTESACVSVTGCDTPVFTYSSN